MEVRGGRAVGRYRIYVFPLISTTFVLFLADFPSFFLYFFTNMLLQSHPGCFARAPTPPVNEGGMVEGGNVKLACSLLKMSKLESFYIYQGGVIYLLSLRQTTCPVYDNLLFVRSQLCP